VLALGDEFQVEIKDFVIDMDDEKSFEIKGSLKNKKKSGLAEHVQIKADQDIKIQKIIKKSTA
jgi:hypothetical protein